MLSSKSNSSLTFLSPTLAHLRACSSNGRRLSWRKLRAQKALELAEQLLCLGQFVLGLVDFEAQLVGSKCRLCVGIFAGSKQEREQEEGNWVGELGVEEAGRRHAAAVSPCSSAHVHILANWPTLCRAHASLDGREQGLVLTLFFNQLPINVRSKRGGKLGLAWCRLHKLTSVKFGPRSAELAHSQPSAICLLLGVVPV